VALSKLVFYGQPDSYYLGKLMYPFLASLAAAALTYIDVSGQQLEDKGAAVLGNACMYMCIYTADCLRLLLTKAS
jgi:hypothetical protein